MGANMRRRLSGWSVRIAAGLVLVLGACGPEDHGEIESASGFSGAPACRFDADSCSLELEHVARIGSFDGDDALEARPMNLVLDGRGRIWLTVSTATLPYVFDTLGTLVMRPGREGDGPGEFRWAWAVTPMSGDSVAVFDSDAGRASVLDQRGRFGRSWPLAQRVHSPVRVGGDTIVASVGSCRRSVIDLVQVVVQSTVVQTFDASGPQVNPFDCLRVLARGPGGTVWSADRHGYMIRKYSLDGTPLDSIQREPEWWQSRSTYDWQIRESPGPFIQAIREDQQGRLWVAIWRDSEHWLEAWRGLSEDRIVGGEVRSIDTPPRLELFSTMIEVWDIKSHRLLVSKRWPGLVASFLRDDLWAAQSQDIYGAEYIEVWRVRLIEGPGEP